MQAKCYARSYCNYSLPGLRKNAPGALNSVTLANTQKHLRKVRHCKFSYLLGMTGGPELEDQVKIFKMMHKLHQRIPAAE